MHVEVTVLQCNGIQFINSYYHKDMTKLIEVKGVHEVKGKGR